MSDRKETPTFYQIYAHMEKVWPSTLKMTESTRIMLKVVAAGIAFSKKASDDER